MNRRTTASPGAPRARSSGGAHQARCQRSARRRPCDRTTQAPGEAEASSSPTVRLGGVADPTAALIAADRRLPLTSRAPHDRAPANLHELFRRLAHATAYVIGTPIAFVIAMSAIIAWAMTGPVFHYSDTWQLVINTGTTVVTFLVVFMIQNTQNRDSQAIHLKLDELIRAVKTARNELVDVEDRSDAELARLQHEMRTACEQAVPPDEANEADRSA